MAKSGYLINLEKIEVVDENFLKKEDPVWANGGPWDPGGIEDRGGVGALEEHQGDHKGGVMAGGLEG